MDVVVKNPTKILNRGNPESAVLWYLRNSKTALPNYNVELVPEGDFDEITAIKRWADGGKFRNTESTFIKNVDVP